MRSQLEKQPRAVAKYLDPDVDIKKMEEKYQRLKKMIQKKDDDDDDDDFRMSEF